jgi:CAAX protease family protein
MPHAAVSVSQSLRPRRARHDEPLGRRRCAGSRTYERSTGWCKLAGSLIKFFSLTYFISWALWTAATTVNGRLGALPFLPGTIAPALVALALTSRTAGRAGIEALLQPIVELPAGARWYIFAVGYMTVVKLAVALLHRLVTGVWPTFGDTPWYLIVAVIVLSTPVQAGEEIGWRGYALPRLSSHVGLSGASIILGVVWGCWHLPLFFIPGSDNAGQSFPAYVLAVTALSVAMAWLYWRTNASLLLTMLMHAAVNNTSGIVRSPVTGAGNPFTVRPPLTAWLTVAVLWVCAVYFIVRMRGATLQSI